MTIAIKRVLPLTLALFVLLSYHFINAQWSTAPSNPPNNNIPAPINVGSGDQVKTGGISADTLSADDGLAVGILNTSDSNAQTYWRVKRNDGTGNFVSYINTEGGSTPTYETTGYAFREKFNVGVGEYVFGVSNLGSVGNSITWDSSLKVLPGGRIGAGQYCDIDGNNCFDHTDISTVVTGTTIVPGWPDAMYCTFSNGHSRIMTPDDNAPHANGLFYYQANGVSNAYNQDGSWNSGTGGSDCTDKSISDLATDGQAFSFGVTAFVPTLDRLSFNSGYGNIKDEFLRISLERGTDWCAVGMCPDAVHSNAEGREAFCRMVLPGSIPIHYSNASFHSPGDNDVVLWDSGAGGWIYGYPATSYNTLINSITCER